MISGTCPPTVGVYSLAWSSAWKLTGAQKVTRVFSSVCHSFFLLSDYLSLCAAFILASLFSELSLFFLSCSFPSRHHVLFYPHFFSLWLADILPIVLPSFPLSSCVCLHFSPPAFIFFFFGFFGVSLDIGQLQLYSNTSQSLLPDEAAYSNHCLASAGPPVQLHNLRSNGVVQQKNVKDFAWFRLAVCQIVIGPRCVFPPYGSFYWLLFVWRVLYLICVCDLVWYDSFCFEKETCLFFFLATGTPLPEY